MCQTECDIWRSIHKLWSDKRFLVEVLKSFLPHRYISILEMYSQVQLIYEFLHSQWNKISLLPTLTPSQGLQNWYFIMKFFPQHNLYVNNTCTKFQGQKIHQKRRYSKSTNMCSCEKNSLLPTSIAFQRLFFFVFGKKFLK